MLVYYFYKILIKVANFVFNTTFMLTWMWPISLARFEIVLVSFSAPLILILIETIVETKTARNLLKDLSNFTVTQKHNHTKMWHNCLDHFKIAPIRKLQCARMTTILHDSSEILSRYRGSCSQYSYVVVTFMWIPPVTYKNVPSQKQKIT